MISNNLQSSYDEQYSDDMNAWRDLCAKFKVQNILEVAQDINPINILECGAGEGSVLNRLSKEKSNLKLSALEISDSGIAQIKKKQIANLVDLKKFDGYQIPYRDQEFDLVICVHVLEHVEHPRLLLRELKRVSKYQAFEIPLDYNNTVDLNSKNLLAYGHINIFTPSIFKFLLKSEGFEILNEKYSYTANEITRYNWYNNQKLKKTFLRELILKSNFLTRYLKKIIYGNKNYREKFYDAYTCLTKNSKDIEIF